MMDAAEKEFCLKKDISQCTICKHVSSKTTLYVCNSGHVLCENCQNESVRQGCGDSISHTHKKHTHNKYRSSKVKKQVSITFASGDCFNTHNGPTTCKDTNIEEKNNNIDPGNCSITIKDKNNKDTVRKREAKLIVQYKNKDYNDNSSSSSTNNSTNVPPVKQRMDKTIMNSSSNSLTRPIACPVCAITISVNSIMSHFSFDHSKLPRLKFTRSVPKHTLLKVFDFSCTTKCYSVLLLKEHEKNKDSTNHTKTERNVETFCSYDNNSFLLMGAKTNFSNSLDISENLDEENHLFRREDDSNGSRIRLFNNDIILLWVCKLDVSEIIYNLTLTREDGKLSFSYTGEAINIRDEQDPQTMYQNATCLTLRGKAVNRLIDANGQLHVVVNIN